MATTASEKNVRRSAAPRSTSSSASSGGSVGTVVLRVGVAGGRVEFVQNALGFHDQRAKVQAAGEVGVDEVLQVAADLRDLSSRQVDLRPRRRHRSGGLVVRVVQQSVA